MPEQTMVPSSRGRYSRPRGSVLRHFAELAGIRESTAAQLVSGNSSLVGRLLKVLRACRLARAPEMADRIMRPLLEEYFEVQHEPYGPHLLQEAARAEAQETVARTDWQLGQEGDAAYLRFLNRAIAKLCELRESIAARSAAR